VRKVNPNRCHLSTDLMIDEQGNSLMTVAAEYILKQSKLHMSMDSNLQVKSSLETSVVPGIQMQVAGEIAHLAGAYKIGFGIVMGS
jgi:hypothetical protein